MLGPLPALCLLLAPQAQVPQGVERGSAKETAKAKSVALYAAVFNGRLNDARFSASPSPSLPV